MSELMLISSEIDNTDARTRHRRAEQSAMASKAQIVTLLAFMALFSLPLLAVGGERRAADILKVDPALTGYNELVSRAANDTADAQVKLALWCDAHGLIAERDEHLNRAVEKDPSNVTARGMLGLVSYQGGWESPAKVKELMEADDALQVKLAEYNRRRAAIEKALQHTPRRAMTLRTPQKTAFDHVKLGIWCESVGLKAEATAHFTTAVVLDPNRDSSWRHLGYIKQDGRWMSREQAATEAAELVAQRKADATWEPKLKKWRKWLADPARLDMATKLIESVDDPRAVPSIVRVFFDRSETGPDLAVRLLARIDAPTSTWGLAEAALRSQSETTRAIATLALKAREPRDYAGKLVDMLESPMTYHAQPVQGPGRPGALVVETPAYRMLRTYDAPPAFDFGETFRGYAGFSPNGLPIIATGRELDRMAREGPTQAPATVAAIEARTAQALAEANFKAAESQSMLVADIKAIEETNALGFESNRKVMQVLAETLDAPANLLKQNETDWKVWWNDKIGYKYSPPEQLQLEVNAAPQSLPARYMSCFVAGTPVRTVDGHRPIDKLAAGDRVLAQDVETGALSFQPVQVVHHNPVGKTVRMELDNGETLVPSIYHRFWRAGKGWVLARNVKQGDVLRTLTGRSKVVSVAPGPDELLFNLDVAGPRTFFVGEKDALVHDNTLPDPRVRCFDAEPDLASMSAVPASK